MKKKNFKKMFYQQQEQMINKMNMLVDSNSNFDANRKNEENGNEFDSLSKASNMAEYKRMEINRLSQEIAELKVGLLVEEKKRKKLSRKISRMNIRWKSKLDKLKKRSDDELQIMLMIFRSEGYTGEGTFSAIKKEIKKVIEKNNKTKRSFYRLTSKDQ